MWKSGVLEGFFHHEDREGTEVWERLGLPFHSLNDEMCVWIETVQIRV